MKAVITALLILGSSSAALAQPVTVAPNYNQFDERDHRNDNDRYDTNRYDTNRYDTNRYDTNRYDNDPYEHDSRWEGRMRLRMRPVTLASNVSLMRQWNRDQRPMLIDIDSRIGGLRRIRIDRNEGRMYVESINIVYADGHQQTVAVRRPLSAREPSLTINLEHDGVTALSIQGTTMRGRATFDVIGLRR